MVLQNDNKPMGKSYKRNDNHHPKGDRNFDRRKNDSKKSNKHKQSRPENDDELYEDVRAL